jgi:hypothetical protein
MPVTPNHEWVDIPDPDTGEFARVLSWEDPNGLGHSVTFGHWGDEPVACILSGEPDSGTFQMMFMPRQLMIEAVCEGWGNNVGNYVWGKE